MDFACKLNVLQSNSRNNEFLNKLFFFINYLKEIQHGLFFNYFYFDVESANQIWRVLNILLDLIYEGN